MTQVWRSSDRGYIQTRQRLAYISIQQWLQDSLSYPYNGSSKSIHMYPSAVDHGWIQWRRNQLLRIERGRRGEGMGWKVMLGKEGRITPYEDDAPRNAGEQKPDDAV
jgi:hypothetical protein